MNLLDFIIGALLANAMPHLIFGLTKTHFLGMFGFSPKGNIMYAILQFVICILLFYFNYGLNTLLENGFLLGGIAIVVLYFIFGKILVNFYGEKKKTATENN
ncbi:hypothetical protein IMCC3317_14790 [Kordia antarctica]|uniref:Uncharacterized protein n=1 Tax=Kordia antarctica TaxID=1218801 RepID=A0A7L4ZHP8_9FLAO|nr:hypothetical protein [Kordia antarctica]QHI36125.1 hypothetical protein IMCC3317_14790 [Kordia antarctica]